MGIGKFGADDFLHSRIARIVDEHFCRMCAKQAIDEEKQHCHTDQ
jgi:hypothetical protein